MKLLEFKCLWCGFVSLYRPKNHPHTLYCYKEKDGFVHDFSPFGHEKAKEHLATFFNVDGTKSIKGKTEL